MMKQSALFLVLTLLSSFLYSQNIEVTGIITDADSGEPIPGATVIILNSNQGVNSDFDGNFNIEVPTGETLSFSFLGYQTTLRVINQNDKLNISLIPNNELDEIVVVGYGTQKRSNIVGSVATVNVDQATQNPTTNEFIGDIIVNSIKYQHKF
jgi:hypothetical protein